jgi:hypothetical protein
MFRTGQRLNRIILSDGQWRPVRQTLSICCVRCFGGMTRCSNSPPRPPQEMTNRPCDDAIHCLAMLIDSLLGQNDWPDRA